MSVFGFGRNTGKKANKVKKSKKSKHKDIWQGQSFGLDDIITPSTLIGGGEHSPEPPVFDVPTSVEIDLTVAKSVILSETDGLELLNPQIALSNNQIITDVVAESNSQSLEILDNQQASTNSYTGNILTTKFKDSCSADNFNPGNSHSFGFPNVKLPNIDLPEIDNPVPILPVDPTFTNKPPKFNFKKEAQPLIGVIDTGFNANNPDIDYDRVKSGKDLVDNDNNPLISNGEGSEHGTHVLGIIGATQDNGIGIDGINDKAPIWVGRAIGSTKWAESLKEFVDEFKVSGQPNGVVNLSFDLTQTNPDGSVTTRYELTPQEREALEYARQNDVLIVAAAGNDGGVMSVLGQASQEFDNIITVGAADGENRAAYSNYGNGLDILADGGTINNPVASTVENSVGTMAGTSVATAQVTGAASQVWAANPKLNYRQIIDILKSTATDLNTPGWDAETGAGLLDIESAVEQAKSTTPEAYNPEAFSTPTTWGGGGQVTPGERAVSAQFNGKYYDWEAYKIKRGDTLSGIAFRTMGNGTAPYYNFIAQKNGIANPSRIYTGQTIYVPKQAAPPTVNLNNTVGYDGASTHQTYINTFNRNGGSTVLGSAINNVHPWGNGYTQDFSGGSESKGAIMKSNANDNSYWVGDDFWTKFLDTGGSGGILGYPTSDRYSTEGGQRQNFQGGAIIKSSQGIFPLFGGIGAHYLNNESGEKGRLGFPTSGEIGIGNGVIVQNFENGRIVYGDGATRTEMNNQPSPPPPTSTTINGYRVDGNFYPVYINYRGTIGNPISGVINYSNGVSYQLFERGSIVSSQYGTFPLYGGIRQKYLNTGGLNGWLGAPKSAEIGQGNGVIIQYFENGYIIWNGRRATAYRNGSGVPSQPAPKPSPTPTGQPIPQISINPNSDNYRKGSVNPFAYSFQGQCTWYTYGRMLETGLLPAGTKQNGWFLGHAESWRRDANRAGLPVTSTPTPGARGIVVWPPGVQGGHRQYGHVAFLEEVYPDGRIRISESNWAGRGISERILTPAQYNGLSFVRLENPRTNSQSSSPQPTPGNSNITWVNFSGTVGPSIGVNLRNSTRLADRSSRNEPNGKRLEFDAWTYGETVTDIWLGTPDSRWFKVKGTNYWVPSAFIYGNPPSSSSGGGNNPVNVKPPKETPNNPQPPSFPNATGAINYMAMEFSNNSYSREVQLMQFLNSGKIDIDFRLAKISAYVIWASLVGAGQKWDHKTIVRNMQDKNNWSIDPNTNKKYNYQSWSNMHYGYIGRIAGFSEFELLNGAGLAQILTNTNGLIQKVINATSEVFDAFSDSLKPFPFNFSALISLPIALNKLKNVALDLDRIINASNPDANLFNPSSIDDPEDQAAINEGFRFYKKKPYGTSQKEFIDYIRSESRLHESYKA